jgi:hypothetical protein
MNTLESVEPVPLGLSELSGAARFCVGALSGMNIRRCA